MTKPASSYFRMELDCPYCGKVGFTYLGVDGDDVHYHQCTNCGEALCQRKAGRIEKCDHTVDEIREALGK